MGSNKRAEERRANRAEAKRARRREHWIKAEVGYAVQVAWCEDDPDVIEDAKQQTHDAVIDQAGENRQSGVQWRIGRGDVAAELLTASCANIEIGDDAAWNEVRLMRAKLREFGGCVIVAICAVSTS